MFSRVHPTNCFVALLFLAATVAPSIVYADAPRVVLRTNHPVNPRLISCPFNPELLLPDTILNLQPESVVPPNSITDNLPDNVKEDLQNLPDVGSVLGSVTSICGIFDDVFGVLGQVFGKLMGTISRVVSVAADISGVFSQLGGLPEQVFNRFQSTVGDLGSQIPGISSLTEAVTGNIGIIDGVIPGIAGGLAKIDGLGGTLQGLIPDIGIDVAGDILGEVQGQLGGLQNLANDVSGSLLGQVSQLDQFGSVFSQLEDLKVDQFSKIENLLGPVQAQADGALATIRAKANIVQGTMIEGLGHFASAPNGILSRLEGFARNSDLGGLVNEAQGKIQLLNDAKNTAVGQLSRATSLINQKQAQLNSLVAQGQNTLQIQTLINEIEPLRTIQDLAHSEIKSINSQIGWISNVENIAVQKGIEVADKAIAPIRDAVGAEIENAVGLKDSLLALSGDLAPVLNDLKGAAQNRAVAELEGLTALASSKMKGIAQQTLGTFNGQLGDVMGQIGNVNGIVQQGEGQAAQALGDLQIFANSKINEVTGSLLNQVSGELNGQIGQLGQELSSYTSKVDEASEAIDDYFNVGQVWNQTVSDKANLIQSLAAPDAIEGILQETLPEAYEQVEGLGSKVDFDFVDQVLDSFTEVTNGQIGDVYIEELGENVDIDGNLPFQGTPLFSMATFRLTPDSRLRMKKKKKVPTLFRKCNNKKPKKKLRKRNLKKFKKKRKRFKRCTRREEKKLDQNLAKVNIDAVFDNVSERRTGVRLIETAERIERNMAIIKALAEKYK